MRRAVGAAVAWPLALAGGALAGGLVYALAVSDPWLAAAVGASTAAAVRLAAAHPDTVSEPGTPAWAVGRWSAAATAFSLSVTLVGTAGLPAGGRRFGHRLLLLGAAWAMWLFGVAYARAKAGDPGERSGGGDGGERG